MSPILRSIAVAAAVTMFSSAAQAVPVISFSEGANGADYTDLNDIASVSEMTDLNAISGVSNFGKSGNVKVTFFIMRHGTDAFSLSFDRAFQVVAMDISASPVNTVGFSLTPQVPAGAVGQELPTASESPMDDVSNMMLFGGGVFGPGSYEFVATGTAEGTEEIVRIDMVFASVPLPASMTLLGAGLGLLMLRRRKTG